MAEPTPVNGQITDAITQSNITVLGSAPAAALANLSHVSAHAFGLMMENAVAAQQAMNAIGQAVVTTSVSVLETRPIPV